MTDTRSRSGIDERSFRADLTDPSFVVGVEEGRWRIVSIEWPIVVVTVTGAPRPGAPDRFALRVDATNYPADAPTATPWDLDGGRPLPENGRPKGDRVGMVFRSDWENGRALYAPFDRVALGGHPGWATEHPRQCWDETRTFGWWIRRVWDLVNDDDYEGL